MKKTTETVEGGVGGTIEHKGGHKAPFLPLPSRKKQTDQIVGWQLAAGGPFPEQ